MAGSKRFFSSRSGTGVGYWRVRQARQKPDSGRRVAAWSPSSERYASEVAPIAARTSATERPAAISSASVAMSIP